MFLVMDFFSRTFKLRNFCGPESCHAVVCFNTIHYVRGLSLIFEVGGDVQKIAGNSSCCSEVNMLVLYQSSWGYLKIRGENPRPLELNDSPVSFKLPGQ